MSYTRGLVAMADSTLLRLLKTWRETFEPRVGALLETYATTPFDCNSPEVSVIVLHASWPRSTVSPSTEAR